MPKGVCRRLGKVEKDARFYPVIDGEEHVVAFGESFGQVAGFIRPKKRDIISCPIEKPGDDISACGDCEFFLAKRRL